MRVQTNFSEMLFFCIHISGEIKVTHVSVPRHKPFLQLSIRFLLDLTLLSTLKLPVWAGQNPSFSAFQITFFHKWIHKALGERKNVLLNSAESFHEDTFGVSGTADAHPESWIHDADMSLRTTISLFISLVHSFSYSPFIRHSPP